MKHYVQLPVVVCSSIFLSVSAMAQSPISGRVVGEKDEALPGTTVTIKGTNRGTTADASGDFKLSATSSETLVFSFIGYLSQEVPVGSKTTFNVTLLPDSRGLGEVVVVGYGTQQKKDLTGAIATVKEGEFAPGPNSDAAQLLKGTAAGVVVTQTSSAPGAALKVQIRGAGSINSSNDVLYVIDGLPGLDPSSLSPGDIESIDVLKDASSAAIYGTRAANGVVLITTKKGKAGKTSLTYSTYVGSQDVAKQIDVLNATDYMRMVNFRLSSRNTAPKYSDQDIANAGVGTNWQSEIFQRALVQNHQVSLSGGGGNTNYYVGLNYFNQDGIVIGSGDSKYNARVNVESRPFEKLKVSTGVNFTREYQQSLYSQLADGGLLVSALRADPTLPVFDPVTGRYTNVSATASDNPVALAVGVNNNAVTSRLYGTLSLDYEITKHLSATVRLGGETNNGRTDIYSSRVNAGRAGCGRHGHRGLE